MHRARLIIAMAVLGVLPSACVDSPAQPDQAVRSHRLSNAWTPDNGNPRIIRFQDNTGFLLIDPVSGLFSIQSWGDGQLGCNSSPTLYSYEDVQAILHNPDDPFAAQVNLLEKGHGIFIAVFRGWSEWFATGMDCGDLFPRKVGDGSGTLTFTDNDYFASFRDSHNSDAFGFVATGRLTLTGGGSAAYTGVSRCEWDGATGAQGAVYRSDQSQVGTRTWR